MDVKWVLLCAALMLPAILLMAYFFNVSMATTGYPVGTFDVVNTHYQHEPTNYSKTAPLIQTLNHAAYTIAPQAYDTYFMLFCVVVLIYFPFVLLHMIFGRLEHSVFFLYGTAIWVNHLVVGLLPQAIFINLMFLVIARPRWVIPACVLGFLAHSLGIFFVVIGYLFGLYRAKEGKDGA